MILIMQPIRLRPVAHYPRTTPPRSGVAKAAMDLGPAEELNTPSTPPANNTAGNVTEGPIRRRAQPRAANAPMRRSCHDSLQPESSLAGGLLGVFVPQTGAQGWRYVCSRRRR